MFLDRGQHCQHCKDCAGGGQKVNGKSLLCKCHGVLMPDFSGWINWGMAVRVAGRDEASGTWMRLVVNFAQMHGIDGGVALCGR